MSQAFAIVVLKYSRLKQPCLFDFYFSSTSLNQSNIWISYYYYYYFMVTNKDFAHSEVFTDQQPFEDVDYSEELQTF